MRTIKVRIADDIAEFLETKTEKEIHNYLVFEWKAKNANRKETRRHCSLDYLIEEGLEPGVNTLDEVDQRIDLKNALSKLPGTQREVLKMYFYEDMTMEQIAEAKGVSKPAVCQQIERATAQLRKLMSE